jgi:hypothetical protein
MKLLNSSSVRKPPKNESFAARCKKKKKTNQKMDRHVPNGGEKKNKQKTNKINCVIKENKAISVPGGGATNLDAEALEIDKSLEIFDHDGVGDVESVDLGQEDVGHLHVGPLRVLSPQIEPESPHGRAEPQPLLAVEVVRQPEAEHPVAHERRPQVRLHHRRRHGHAQRQQAQRHPTPSVHLSFQCTCTRLSCVNGSLAGVL